MGLVLSPLERALLSDHYSGPEDRGLTLLMDIGDGGAVEASLLEGGAGEGQGHAVVLYAGRMPLRAGSVRGAVVRGRSLDDQAGLLLLELNRALTDNGILILVSRRAVDAGLLLTYGFAAVSEHREQGGLSATLSRKVWRKYLRDSCPRCGGTLVLPLIPPDASVRKVWTVYCASCSYNWGVVEPITEWF